MGERVARELTIHGRVQGVFFRAFARDAATRHGVAGSAENRPDGTVAVWLEGPPDAVAAVERACAEGPERASVERLDAADAQPAGLDGFAVD